MIKNQKGQILLLTVVALGVVLFTVLFVIGAAQLYFQNAQYSVDVEKALALAEAGVDKALTSLNKTGGSYNGEAETSYGAGSYSVTITDKDASTKILQATGYIPAKTNPRTKRTVTIKASKGAGISFVYGLQVGEGGINMGTGAIFNGSIYSNGNITGGNNATFIGDVWIAGAAQASADVESDCNQLNCQDYIFGKAVSGENRQDIAQSFKPTTSGVLNKVSLKFKKFGLPTNPTVRIMTDANGKPNKNNVLATGTLSANLVTEEYGFIDITFDTTPTLEGNTIYWIMVHTQSLDAANYWSWSNDFAQGYPQGGPKWSSDWQTGDSAWTDILGDLGFRTFLGGAATLLNLGNGSVVSGDVHANMIEGNMTITKDAYYQNLGPSVVVSGTKYPGSADPAPTVFPISEANMTDWKNQAEAAGSGGSISGCVATLGPGKINGDVLLGNSCNTKVIAPVWITGTLNTGNSTKLILDQDFGPASGVIIVDGKTVLGNGADILGSGTKGSYLMLLVLYSSIINGDAAITIGNSSISGILYAPLGKVELANGAAFREITAWGINLGTSAILNYQSGFASTFFSSGPSGSYSLVKGTYQVK
ncbi:hypothetical protein HYU93_01110 [Candidatus Daviesbacteria bacterium]|nr:hypothetical protein [Candidatus Daviesbacteria bacterium]